MSNKKKIVVDMCLNIIAVTIPVAVLQLIVYPITAKSIGGDSYGLMITIYSVWIMISNSLGNVLNNIRLLYENAYLKQNIKGDFNILLGRWGLINSIIICGIIIFYCKGLYAEHIILGIIISLLIITKDYTEVGFRLNLNYKAIY